MKICPVGAELLQTDGGTDGQPDRERDSRVDMTKLIFTFRIFIERTQ